jgi:alpha-D-xyloside xylohydrolase
LRYNGLHSDIIGTLTGRAPLVWGRSGWAGSQRYPGQWGGDAESTVVGMQATLRGGLSYATCAPGYWSHDIGGFYGPELTPGLYIRWTQFGALSPLMRAHGLRPREPWEFGPDALRVCRAWIRLRYSLLPYLWQVGGEVEAVGLPFIRPLCLQYPDDRVALDVDDEYLLGRDILVAPVMDDSMQPVTRTIYLPAGTWYDFFTDERFEGPTFIKRQVSIEEMPVFVRSGAVVPRVLVTPETRNADDLRAEPWTVHVWGDVTQAAIDSLEGFDGQTTIAEIVRHG